MSDSTIESMEQRRNGNYKALTARIGSEAARRGWTVRRARTELRLLMNELNCDTSAAVEMLEQGKTSLSTLGKVKPLVGTLLHDPQDAKVTDPPSPSEQRP